jgi:hypothetical protein
MSGLKRWGRSYVWFSVQGRKTDFRDSRGKQSRLFHDISRLGPIGPLLKAHDLFSSPNNPFPNY